MSIKRTPYSSIQLNFYPWCLVCESFLFNRHKQALLEHAINISYLNVNLIQPVQNLQFVVRCSPSNGENGKNGGAHKEQEVWQESAAPNANQSSKHKSDKHVRCSDVVEMQFFSENSCTIIRCDEKFVSSSTTINDQTAVQPVTTKTIGNCVNGVNTNSNEVYKTANEESHLIEWIVEFCWMKLDFVEYCLLLGNYRKFHVFYRVDCRKLSARVIFALMPYNDI